MLINQKRVAGTSKLRGLADGNEVKVIVKNPKLDILNKMGFGVAPSIGECILPKVIGPSSRFNANGKYFIHREQEKELCYRMNEWPHKEFNGPGELIDVITSVDVPYYRYPRTLISPFSIEFAIDAENNQMFLTSPLFVFGQDNEKIVTAINVLLEYFGYCEVISEGFKSSIKGELIRLNWRILPKGKVPWEEQRTRILPFLAKAKGSNQKVVEKRLETININSPDFTAIGEGGFSGYVIHGFTEKGIFVLESIEVNNATYVLSKNWEEISKLTKAEIIKNELHEYRVIHNKGWYDAMGKILK